MDRALDQEELHRKKVIKGRGWEDVWCFWCRRKCCLAAFERTARSFRIFEAMPLMELWQFELLIRYDYEGLLMVTDF